MCKKARKEPWSEMLARQDRERKEAAEGQLRTALLIGALRDADEDDPDADPDTRWNDIDE